MQTVHSNRPAFPHATLSRMTGFSEQAFADEVEDLGQIDFASFDASEQVTADNAYLLAASSALVYESESAQAAFLEGQPSVESFHFLDSIDNEELGMAAPDTGTQLGLIETDDALIVSARGTVFAAEGPGFMDREWADVINNINVVPTANYNDSAFVHSGFKNASDGIWEQLVPHLEEAVEEGKALHFTGHSLGGAIATHLCDRTQQTLGTRPTSLVTFGGPAVGWAGERRHLEDSGIAEVSLRFADAGDPTVYAVPWGRHAGPEGYFDRERTLERGEGWNVLDRLSTSWDDLRHSRHPIGHHHPLNYCELVSENRDVLERWD